MPVVSRFVYEVVKWRGLTRKLNRADAKTEAKQRSVRGETFAYWYLWRQGMFLSHGTTCPAAPRRNWSGRLRRRNSGICRSEDAYGAGEDQAALPELSVTWSSNSR